MITQVGAAQAARTVGRAEMADMAEMTSTEHAFPSPGFADPTRDAQRVFRAVLDALSHPTRRYPLAGPPAPPAALGGGLAAIALALLDEDCTVWLGGALGRDTEVSAWLAFHTGAGRANSTAAGFVIADPGTLPPLDSLAVGTDEAPHRSVTVVLDVRGCAGTGRFSARGPGIAGTATLTAPWAPDGFADTWRRNTGLFPRGVDLLLVDADSVTAVPRTTRLSAPGLEATGPETTGREASVPETADQEREG